MKILNLVYPEKSDIKYKISNFPDGQKNILIGGMDLQSDWFHYLTPIIQKEGVQIRSRLNTFSNLEEIICSVKSLRNLGVKEIHLYVPYFLGSRSDRNFEEGSCNYLKDVICPIINSLNFESVTVLDPHSQSLECCLNNFKSLDNKGLIDFFWKLNPTKGWGNYVLISPDGGSLKKIYKVAEKIGYKGDIVTCGKDRDNNGKLTKCVVPDFDLSKDVVIIDDIFDFGGTFKAIGATMNDMGHTGKKYLIVTHSVQTKGLIDALKWFDGIYTTNSVKEHEIDGVYQLDVF